MPGWKLSRRSPVAGEEIAWDVHGDGPPVVLVHGFPGHSYSFRHLAPDLAADHRVYVVDLAGFGASAQHEGQAVHAAAQARRLAALLEAWGLERPDVVAHDFGASVVLGAYLYEACRYRRVVLLDAATLNPCISENSQHARKYLEAYQTLPARLFETLMRAHIPTTMHTAMDEETFAAYLRPWQGPVGQAAYYRFLGQLDEGYLDRVETELGSFTPPTRIVWGHDDTWIPLAQGEKLAGLLPDAELVTVPSAGHFLLDDAPDAVAAAVREFLGAGGSVR